MQLMVKKYCIIYLLIFIVFIFNDCLVALASSYGDGVYGEGQYNVGSTPALTAESKKDSKSPSPDFHCDDIAPKSAPWLNSAIPQDNNSILLTFNDAADPVEYFELKFGRTSGNYEWGSIKIGDKSIRSYLVKNLSPNTTYYFVVRAGNGCAAGSWSNELSSIIPSRSLFEGSLNITSSMFKTSESENQIPTCKNYTVKDGDTLRSIAFSQLNDSDRYKDIIDLNKVNYPSLLKSESLEIGWDLIISCEDKEKRVELADEKGLYELSVKVIDIESKPVEGAKVTIHSNVQESVTDKDGIAKFNNVEPGNHKVLISYKGYSGEQSVNIAGEVKNLNLTITIEKKSAPISPVSLCTISVLIFIIVLLILWQRKKH